MRRWRAVAEDVAQMSAAAPAIALGTDKALGMVGRHHGRSRQGLEEARPSGAAVELCARGENREPAARAGVGAPAMLAVQRARMRLFGFCLAQDRVLLGREQRP